MLDYFAERLLEWYEAEHRDLPWRRTADPYRIWISEIMLQQTQVETVIDYYNRFIERFEDLSTLAEADLDEVLKLWEGLGYYSRARNLHRCAVEIVAHHDGVFPDRFETLRKLPGIGPYTAGAIMSIAFNQPYPAVDGNVMRVLSRHDGIEEDIAQTRTRALFEKRVLEMMPPNASHFNQGLMEMGAMVCLPRNPRCGTCPVAGTCIALREEKQSVLPVKSKKARQKRQKVAFAWVEVDRAVLMEKQTQEGLLSGLWTLPMLEVEGFTRAPERLGEYLGEKYGLEVQRVEKIRDTRHVFTHRIWEMRLYRVTVVDRGRQSLDWLTRESIGSRALSVAVKKLWEGM